MVKWFYVVLIACIVGFAISEFAGLWPERFGSVSRLNDLLGVLAILLVVLSLAVMALPSVTTRSFRTPLRKEYRRIEKRLRPLAAAEGSDLPDTSLHGEFFTNLTAGICTLDEHTDTSPARLIALARQHTGTPAEWPWQLPELALWAQSSEARLRSNVLLRFLLKDRLETVSLRLQTLHAYALGLPVAPPGIAERQADEDSDQIARRAASRAFASAVESHTGASVLATGLHTRAGVDTVRLWHSDRVFSQDPTGGRDSDARNYTDDHLTTGAPLAVAQREPASTCDWEKKLKDGSKYLIGDRDNHVPILDGVTVSENRWAGTIEFVLSTHSSCSAATDHSPYACKGKVEELRVGSAALWTEHDRVVKRNYSTANDLATDGALSSVLESNLAVHVVLVITDDSNDRYIVLVERGNTFRFGNRMLTVPSETLALSAGGRRGHVDEHGAPDLLRHAASGLRRAVGIDLTPEQLRPSHVVMVNQRESEVSATEGRSQLVSSVGFTASLAATQQDIQSARAEASRISQHGVQGLMFLPLGSASNPAPEATIEALLHALESKQEQMDQMSTTAALIVAGRLLGVEHVRHALAKRAAAGSPSWWQSQWRDEPGIAGSRAAVGLSQSRVIQS